MRSAKGTNITGRLTDLTQAIDLLEEAVRAHRAGRRDLGHGMANLGAALNALYEERGDVGDLERAIVMIEAAIAATPRIPPTVPDISTLWQRARGDARANRRIADLDGAIDRDRQAVARASPAARAVVTLGPRLRTAGPLSAVGPQ